MKTPRFLVSGGFDPFHDGHADLFKLGGFYSVGLMTDAWLLDKKGHVVMSYTSRQAIMESIHSVDEVVSIGAEPDATAKWLKGMSAKHSAYYNLFFVNGGDRSDMGCIPKEEADVMLENGITPLFFGDGKKNSSSWITSRLQELQK